MNITVGLIRPCNFALNLSHFRHDGEQHLLKDQWFYMLYIGLCFNTYGNGWPSENACVSLSDWW